MKVFLKFFFFSIPALLIITYFNFEIFSYIFEKEFTQLALCNSYNIDSEDARFINKKKFESSTSPFIKKYFISKNLTEIKNFEKYLLLQKCNDKNINSLELNKLIYVWTYENYYPQYIYNIKMNIINNINKYYKLIYKTKDIIQKASITEAKLNNDRNNLCYFFNQNSLLSNYARTGLQCRKSNMSKKRTACHKIKFEDKIKKDKENLNLNLSLFIEKWSQFIEKKELHEICNEKSI